MAGLDAGRAFVDIQPRFDTFGSKIAAEVATITKAGSTIATAGFAKGFQAIGASASVLGRHLSTNVTLPLAAIGVAAFKVSADFETAFARMQGLAGVSAGEVDGLRDSVLQLSGETGRAPQELADALYFLRSAGLDSKTAMEALEVSAKGAAIGLGTTDVIAQTVAASVNAYAKTGLTAAEATDILAGTTQEATFEASELAGAIGRIIPVAATMGVPLEQVGAALAVMSQQGLDANEAVTALRQIMVNILNPTKEARELLASVGLSAEGLRQNLKEKGLLDTLNLMSGSFEGNSEAAAQLIGDVRGLVGFLNITGAEGEKTRETFEKLANTTGKVDEAFAIAAETANFKMSVAMSKVKIALIEAGEALAPVAEKLASFVGSAADGFASLEGPAQNVALGLLGIAAAAGPVIFLGGKLASGLGLVIGGIQGGKAAFDNFRLGLMGVSEAGAGASNAIGGFVNRLGPAGMLGGLALVGAALTVGMIVLDKWKQEKEAARQRVVAFTDALQADNGALGSNTRAMLENALEAKNQADDLGRLKGELTSGRAAFDVFADAVNGNVDAQREFRAALIASGEVQIDEHFLKAGESVESVTRAFIRGDDVHRSYLDGNVGLVDSFRQLTAANAEAKAATEGTADAQRTAADVQKDLTAATTRLQDLRASGTASEQELAEASQDVANAQKEQAAVTGDVTAGSELMTGATDAAAGATEDLAGQAAQAAQELEGFKDKLDGIFGVVLNAEAASLSYRDSIRSLSESFTENGATLEENTKEGDANRQAMLDSTNAAIDLADAMVQESGDVNGATLILGGHAGQLIETAKQTGMSERAAIDYAARLLSIPPDVATSVTNSADFARLVVEYYKTSIAAVPANKNTTFDADTSAAKAKIFDLSRSIDDLQGRFNRGITLNVGGGNRVFAEGGRLQEGWNIVGDAGPELAIKRGAAVEVFSNEASRKMIDKAKPVSSGPAVGNTDALVAEIRTLGAMLAQTGGITVQGNVDYDVYRQMRRDERSKQQRARSLLAGAR